MYSYYAEKVQEKDPSLSLRMQKVHASSGLLLLHSRDQWDWDIAGVEVERLQKR
jgi:hypothetical protein